MSTAGNSRPVRAFVCDFGGVLTTPLIESFVAYQRDSGVTPEALAEAMGRATETQGAHPLYELEKGAITEVEFRRQLEQELDGASLEGFREIYFENLHPNERMIDYVRSLRDRGLRMAMLTNNVREWEPMWRAKLPDLDEIFEFVVDSAFVGVRKPDPAIYRLTVERLGGDIETHDCLFLDDLDVNCQAARDLGMRAVRFVDNDQAIAELDAALAGDG